jgi:NADPH:quinone reductase-like Zn-dependent oxidoreductase
MQAIVLSAYGSAANFRMAELAMPVLRQGDVRIKVRSVSFNPIDFQIRRGSPGSAPVTSPVLGRDLSGVVDAVHETVVGFQPGDDVYSCVCKLASSGTYAEYVCVPEELVARKPTRLTHEQAAAVPVAGITASLAFERGSVDEATSLFVAGGAGGVGSFAVMLARQLGLRRLITTAGNAASRAYLIEKCGLRDDQIVNYKDDDFMTRAIAMNGGPFDCVLDLVGGSMLSAGCAALAVEGHVVSVTEAPSQESFELLFERNASFHAVGAHAYSLMDDRTRWRKYQQLLDWLAKSFDSGTLQPPHFVNVGELSVEAVRRAHDLLERGMVQGKLVMSCGQGN